MWKRFINVICRFFFVGLCLTSVQDLTGHRPAIPSMLAIRWSFLKMKRAAGWVCTVLQYRCMLMQLSVCTMDMWMQLSVLCLISTARLRLRHSRLSWLGGRVIFLCCLAGMFTRCQSPRPSRDRLRWTVKTRPRRSLFESLRPRRDGANELMRPRLWKHVVRPRCSRPRPLLLALHYITHACCLDQIPKLKLRHICRYVALSMESNCFTFSP